MLRTNALKALAEEYKDEYEEWLEQQLIDGVIEPMDIFAWVGMQYMTAQEEYNDYLKDKRRQDGK